MNDQETNGTPLAVAPKTLAVITAALRVWLKRLPINPPAPSAWRASGRKLSMDSQWGTSSRLQRPR